jgi:phosphoglycerate dehydrogenase-like enzyme
MKLVIHPPVEEARLEKIRAAAGTMAVANCGSSESALAEIAGADAFFGKLTPPLLEAARNLRWVQSPTASLEHYMFPGLVAHPCTLTNMRGLFSDVIADQVMGYVICFARNLHVYIRQQFERKWAPVGMPAFRADFAAGPGVVNDIDRAHLHLSGTVLGVVGYGAIGREIARRAQAFGIRTLAVDPVQADAWRLDRLPDLLAQSDFVLVAAPHTPKTVRMFDAARFAQMKPSAYFINIGRGAIVDLDHLVAALGAGVIAGAALDVYETEPLPPAHPLWTLPNAILTPHVAGYSPRVPERHLEVLLANVRAFSRGEPLSNVVDKAEWF